MKKLIALAICVMMLMSLVPVGVFATAEDGVITAVDVKGFRFPFIGETASDYLDTLYLPDGAEYAFYTSDVVSATGLEAPLEGDEVFEEGKEYYLSVILERLEGYTFGSELPSVYFNGQETYVDSDYTKFANAGQTRLQYFTVNLSPVVRITGIDVAGFTFPEPNGTAGEALSDLEPADGAHFALADYFWVDADSGLPMADDEIFEPGGTYYLRVVATPDFGYGFDPDVVVYLDGDDEFVDSQYTGVAEETGDAIFYTVEFSFPSNKIYLDAIGIEGYFTPEVGETVEENLYWLDTLSDQYSIVEAHWQAYMGEYLADDYVFEADTYYWIYLVIEPGEDCSFFGAVPYVSLNGDDSLIDYDDSYVDGGTLHVYTQGITPVMPERIDEVGILGFVPPAAGMSAGDNVSSITLPEDAHYYIDVSYWDGYSGSYLEDDDVFLTGRTYYLVVYLVADDGYYFDKTASPTPTINGSGELVDTYVSRVFDRKSYDLLSIDFEIEGEDPFVHIMEIYVTGYTDPVIGQTAGDNLASFAVAESEPYTVYSVAWVEYEPVGQTQAAMNGSDVFREGYEYYLTITLEEKSGYVFDDAAVVYIDGSMDLWDFAYGFYYSAHTVRFYTVNVEPLPAEPGEFETGDINGDNSVDLKDVLLLRRAAAGLVELTAEQEARADVVVDGSLDLKDILKLRRMIAGLE